MAYGSSWRSKGHDLDPRDVVEEAARAAGMSVEEWLDTAAESTFDNNSRIRRKNRSSQDDDSPLSRLAKRIERRESRMRDDGGRDYYGNSNAISEDRVSRIVSDAVDSFQDSLRANEERVALALEAMTRAQKADQTRSPVAEMQSTRETAKSPQTAPAIDYSALSKQLENRIENVLNSLEAKAQTPAPQITAQQVSVAPVIERQNRDLRANSAINAALAKVNAALRGLEQSPQQNEILKTLRSLDQRLSGLEKAPQHNPEMIGQMVGEMAAIQQHMSKQKPGADLSVVNKHMLSLGDRIDALTRNFGAQPAQSTQLAKQFSSQFASQFERLTAEISELRTSLKTPAPAPDLGIETLRNQMSSMGDHLSDLTQKIAALRTASVENQIPPRDIENDLNELKYLIQNSQMPVHDERVLNAVKTLEQKIAAAERAPTALMDRLDRIQAMMGEKTVATLPPHVENMLQGLAARLQSFENAPQDDLAFARLHEEIQQISRKLEQTQATQHHPVAADVSGLERAVSAILQQVDGLKTDMGSLAESAARRATQEALSQISAPAPVMSQPDLTGVEQSIQSLFRQIDGWKADMGMVAEDAARRAAAEAMRQAPLMAPPSNGPDTFELQRALGDMQLSQKDAERRTTQTLEAVHDTLKRVVDRLVDMEKDIEAKTVVAAAAPAQQAYVPPVSAMPLPLEPMAVDAGRKPLNIQVEAPEPVYAPAPVLQASPPATAPAWNTGTPVVEGAAATVAAMRAQRMGVSSPSVTTSPPSKGPISAAIEAARNAVSGIKLPSKTKGEPQKTTDAPQITPVAAPAENFAQLLEPGSGRPQKANPAATAEANDPKAKFLAAARQAAQVAAGHAADALDDGQNQKAGKGKKSGLKSKHALLLGLAALILAVGATLQFTGLPKSLTGAPKKEVVGTIDHMRKQIQLSHEHRRNEIQQTASAGNRLPSRQILAEVQEPPLPAPLARPADAARPEPTRSTNTLASTIAPTASVAADPVTVGSIGPTIQSNIRQPETSVKPAISVSNDPLFQFEGLKDAAGLRAAARNGEVAAYVELGNRFADGKGAQLNPKTAALWFERAAEQGSAPARYRLGTLYREGKGVDRNPKLALAHFLGAAELGNARAMHNAAVLLAEGVNGSPDYAGAAEWFKRAAEYGIRDSQYNLAILYARGLGVSQDLAASYSWFSAAAKQGDEDSMKKRDEVASRLPADQLKIAREASVTWKAKKPDVTANETLPIPSSWDVPTRTPTPTSQLKQNRS